MIDHRGIIKRSRHQGMEARTAALSTAHSALSILIVQSEDIEENMEARGVKINLNSGAEHSEVFMLCYDM